MKDKVLYIDFLSPHGHIFFNNIYIRSILKCKYNVIDFVFQSHYKGKFEFLSTTSKYKYFHSFKNNNKIPHLNAIQYRLYLLMFQLNCMYIAYRGKYTKIIISSFDNYAIRYFCSKADVYAICHNNIEMAQSSQRQSSVLKTVSKKINLIALNMESYKYLKSINCNRIHCLPHGYLDRESSCFKNKRIYVPINDFIDKTFCTKILSDEFDKYLCSIGYKLLVKKNLFSNDYKFKNIEFINRYLSEDEYNSMLSESDIILLPYDIDRYKYRSSAIFMEAISFNKKIIAPYCENFKNLKLKGDFGITLYNDYENFISLLSDLINDQSDILYTNVKSENSIDKISENLQKIL